MERFKPPMSKVKPALGIGVSTVLSFKPPMSKVKQTDKEENDNKVESFKPPMSKVKRREL